MLALAPPIVEEPRPGLVRHAIGRALDLVTLAFGFATLVLILATVAAIPVVQLVSLGYLLEAEGRVARTGRFREALPELRLCARIGGAAIGLLFVFLPAIICRDAWTDAWLIDPTSRATHNLRTITLSLGAFALLHASFALARGGRLSFFFRPLANVSWARKRLHEGVSFSRVRWALLEFVDMLDVPHHFVLGLKGFVAVVVWIAIPTLILWRAMLHIGPATGPVTVFGSGLLALALIPLPLLQARLAAEGRLRAGFELRAVWRHYRRAPIAALIALVLTLALALPLYAFKVELIPRDARWLPSVLFVLLILPTKLIAGKAYSRGAGEGRAFFPIRFLCTLLGLAAAGAYVGVLNLYGFIEWGGTGGLIEQHAFLVPTPFY